MSKLNPNSNSKLSGIEIPVAKTTKHKIPESIMSRKASRTSSFSLKKKDKERLFNLLEKITPMTERKITATDILRGLLISGIEMNEEELFSYVKKSFIE